jgi:mRNA-degrading endonuclease RelE of RelBE toxin-antitoxin system
MYSIEFYPGWDKHFNKFDRNTRQTLTKKIEKQISETKARHMKQGLDFFVLEAGQYRIALKINERQNIKTIYFVGNHKQYEKWYLSFIQ